ncbi:MAG: RNA polymerase sigma factor [Ruminococcaceae bacterium]|nr:RNA polymerase sigma factor [Oscillospiraceae bacterium]
MKSSPAEQFEHIYSKYCDTLYRLALSHLLNKEDAEDAVHDVFVKYINSPFHFFGEEHEKAWFIRVTINHCHDMRRKRKVRSHSPLDEAHEIAVESGVGEFTESVFNLEDTYKTPILLHYYEGYSVEETARIMRISVSAVKMRLKRAREKLKSEFSGD